MKIKIKLILLFSFFLIPIILMWLFTNKIIEDGAKEHAHEVIHYYASTFALTIGREKEHNKNGEITCLFNDKDDLEDYLLDISKIKILIWWWSIHQKLL